MQQNEETPANESNRTCSPLVSVIIPVYNRRDLLKDALLSVKEQSFTDYELIVVDDASTEDLKSLVLAEAPHARYFRHQENRGAAGARNTGIQAAVGKYIACLDSDDMWLPTKLEMQVRFLEANPGIGLVGAGVIYVDEQGEYLSGPHFGPEVIPYEMFCIRASLPGSGANEMIPRRVFEEIGLFNEKMRRAQDWEMWLRIAKKYPVRVLREPLLKRRAHRTARHAINEKVVKECREMLALQVDDPRLRQANRALTEFRIFQNRWLDGNRRSACMALIKSFQLYPRPIPFKTRRLIPAMDLITPTFMKFLRGTSGRNADDRGN